MAADLETASAPVRYDELPGVGHNAWDPAYAGDALSDCLFRERRR